MVALNAVVGAVMVVTGLNPYVVAAHSLAAMLLLSAIAASYDIAHRHGAISRARPSTTALARVVAVLAALLVVVGAVVTGAGPHPGDSSAVARIPLDWALVTTVHGALAIAVLVATVMCIKVAGRHGDVVARRRALVLGAVLVAQALLGNYQSLAGLPSGAVVVQLLGAALVWVGVIRLLLAAPTHRATSATTTRPAATVLA